MVTISEALRAGVAHQQAGRWAEAEQIYRQVLAAAPDHPDALHLLGLVAHHYHDRLDDAAELINRAIERHPNATFYGSLAMVYLAQGRAADALHASRRTLELRPGYPGGFNHLGLCLQAIGDADQAVEAFRRAIALNPLMVEAHVNLGIALQGLGRRDAAVACYEAAIQCRPDYALAHGNLGTVLKELGRREEALAAYETSVRLNPRYAISFSNMGTLLAEMKRYADAETAYREAIRLKPLHAKFHYNLANLHKDQFWRGEAEAGYRRAIEIDPQLANAYVNLGIVLQDQGRIGEARELFKQATEMDPNGTIGLSNRLMNELYQPDTTPEQFLELLDVWHKRQERPLMAARRPHKNVRDPLRRLRVGFVSADFGVHPIGRLMTHVLNGLDPAEFESYCYSHRTVSDVVTEKLKRAAHYWRNVFHVDDDALAEQIRRDEIDILVDLSGHTAGNRLLVFARRPAPVQVTWMGYAASTGLHAMDWLLTDAWLVPPDCDRFYREKIWRLPLSGACYALPEEAPPVGSLPCRKTGSVTLSCFNNPIKITQPTMLAWGRILHQLPTARLILKYQGLHDPTTRQSISERLESVGIDPSRVELAGMSPLPEMLACYQSIDLALDPFPYTGGTSTILALWMGVPVVSLFGPTLASRQTYSILASAGLESLVVDNVDAYVERAVTLAQDQERLGELRAELRRRMVESPFCNPGKFMPTLGPAFRGMWRQWCEAT